MKHEQNSFLSNSIITLTRQFASIVIGFLLLIVVANSLGKEGQGDYTLITYLPLMVMTFLNLGLNSSTVYFVSKKDISVDTAFSTNIITAVILSIIGIVSGYIATVVLAESMYNNVNLVILQISLFALPGMFLMIFLQTLIQGLQNFKAFNTALVIQQMSTVTCMLLFLLLFDWDLIGAVYAFGLGYIVSVFYMTYFLVVKVRAKFSVKLFSFNYLKNMLSYGIKAHISNMMTFLNYRQDVFLLGLFSTSASVGVYSLAVNLGERLSIFSQSFSQVLLPKISSLEVESDRNKITSMVSRFILIFITLISIVLFFLSDLIFRLFFPEYPESSLLLKLLLPGLTVLAVEKILSNDLAGRGKPEINMYVSFFNVGFNIILNLFLIPKYGAVGAAISSSVTYVFSFIIKVLVYKHVTKLKVNQFLLVNREDFILVKKLVRKVTSRGTN